MAVLDGHPAYEAVEAMIRRRTGETFAVRAIITRHDQTQVDHINDDGLAAEMAGADREIVRRDIALELAKAAQGPRAVLSFRSFADETVVLDITAAGPPLAEGAGLTDPGDHSLDASLPMMWRGKSALAGPETHVRVGGRRFDAPLRFARGAFTAHEGYYTERHIMGAVRAGSIEQTVLAAPSKPAVGGEWVFRRGDRKIVWRATPAADGRLAISGGSQSVIARPDGDALLLDEVRVGGGDGLCLRFPDEGFAFDMAGERGLVVGAMRHDDGALLLEPQSPSWAAARPVRVAIRRDDSSLVCETRVGA